MEYYIGLTIIILIITWFTWKISIIFSSNNDCPFHGVPSTEGMGEIPEPVKSEVVQYNKTPGKTGFGTLEPRYEKKPFWKFW